MNTTTIVLLVILVILIGVLVAVYLIGKNLQKRQTEASEKVEETKQPVTMLVIDKKKMKLKQANLPPQVYQNTPWYLKRSKVSIVRAKVGPQIIDFVCDDAIFDSIPIKKQIRAMVSGIFIAEAKGMKGQKLVAPEVEKNAFGRFMDKVRKIGGADPIKRN